MTNKQYVTAAETYEPFITKGQRYEVFSIEPDLYGPGDLLTIIIARNEYVELWATRFSDYERRED